MSGISSIAASAVSGISSIAASTVSFRRVSIKTEFHKGTNYSLTVLLKRYRFLVKIPRSVFLATFSSGKSSSAQSPFELTFSSKPSFRDEKFGKFIADKLKTVVTNWQSDKQASSWCEHERVKWRDEIQENWLRGHERKRKHVHGDTNNCFFMVQVPRFLEGPVQHITIKFEGTKKRQKTLSSTDNRPYMFIPKALVPSLRNRKRVKVGQYSEDWISFLRERLQYVVDRWTKLEDAQQWCQEFAKNFVKLARRYFDDMRKNNECKFWEVKKSVIPVDPTYVRKEYFPKDAKTGSGLFCTKAGAHKIYFGGEKLGITERILRSETNRVTKVQGWYQVQVHPEDDNLVDVPTTESTNCGVVHHGFIVNHRSINPTHDLVIEKLEGKCIACLVPHDGHITAVGEEFCFDYGYEHSKNVPTV